MLTSCRSEPMSVAGATHATAPVVGPSPRRGSADLPCRERPDLWFAETSAELELAKAFCGGCPARVACLAGALGRREPCGVWGGEIFDRGRVVARKRGPGRRRRNAFAA